MIKKNKIPTILGIILLLAGVFAGVILLRNNQVFRIGASPTIAPKDVRIGSVSDSSVTISWLTADKTTNFISFGTTPNVGTTINESENDENYSTHSITITGLVPETIYYFKINSNGTMFDNNGVPWQFTTGKTLTVSQVSMPVSGSVMTASGAPSKRALVYIVVNGYVISSLTSNSGTFVLQLGSARNTDLSAYAQIDSNKTLLEVSAISETGEIATAKIFPRSANPIPTLIIGQDQDFRSLEPVVDGQNPDADLSLPAGSSVESKLNVDTVASSPTKNVTLESVTEGEAVTTDVPEFFGNGPTGTSITISVHSDTEITGSTKVSSSGIWKWSPPSNLAPGAHTVTVSWIDTSGITRTLTRNFVVQAGELPAFVATPTATPKLTPTPTSSPTPTPTIKATSTPTITPTLTPKSTATPAALPESGSLTPTILMLMMSLGVITFSFYVWKESKN